MSKLARPAALLVACAVSCVSKSDTRPFDDLTPSGGKAGAGGGTTGNGATTAAAAVSSSSTGTPTVQNCHCIHDVYHLPACGACEATARAGSCAPQYSACLADTGCTAFLQQFCPSFTQLDDPSAVAQCLNAGSAQPLLVAYFDCLCSNPGACSAECEANLACGAGSGGAGGTGTTTGATTGASTSSASSTSTGG
jgi:hypothetical protein